MTMQQTRLMSPDSLKGKLFDLAAVRSLSYMMKPLEDVNDVKFHLKKL